MATDLALRAQQQRDRHQALANQALDILTLAHQTRSAADEADAAAREHLADLVAAEGVAREALATAVTPGEVDTLQAELQTNLVAQAHARTGLRATRQRLRAAQVRLSALQQPVSASQSDLAQADAHLVAATAWQAEIDALGAAVGQPPLDTMAGDAADLLASQTVSDAQAHLATLVPDPLRTLASDRRVQAIRELADLDAHLAQAGEDARDVLRLSNPLATDVEEAQLGFDLAVAALARHVHGAAARLTTAVAIATEVLALPAATTEEQATLTALAAPDAVIEEETVNAAAIALRDARHALDDAILTAVVGDPDTAPEDDTAVGDAMSVRDDAVGVVTAAASAYDQAAMDAWEVEVRPAAWDALSDLTGAIAALEELADPALASSLVAAVDDATDVLGAALDEADLHARRQTRVALATVERTAATTATREVRTDLIVQRLRGDGVAGLTSAQLGS